MCAVVVVVVVVAMGARGIAWANGKSEEGSGGLHVTVYSTIHLYRYTILRCIDRPWFLIEDFQMCQVIQWRGAIDGGARSLQEAIGATGSM